ncbi:MAG: hypothetical protein KKF93_00220 [Candidatus Omnitrophica bacterium]|nr:hypothetical protein [Candidatus Omnitrophota bacterium]
MNFLFLSHIVLLVICDVLLVRLITAPGWGSLDAFFLGLFFAPLTIIAAIVYYMRKARMKFKPKYRLLEGIFMVNFGGILALLIIFGLVISSRR